MVAIAHPAPRSHGRPAGGHLRAVGAPRPLPAQIYRRRRIVAALLVAVLLVAAAMCTRAVAGALGGVPLRAPGPPASAVSAAETGPVYVVQPGDTLWAIARRLSPSGDIRATVDLLAAANGGAHLQPGDRITLPG